MALSTDAAKDKHYRELGKRHLEMGMAELVALAQCLRKIEEDPTVHQEVRKHIETASKELALVAALAQAELDKVDSQCEELMRKKQQLQDEKQAKHQSLEALKSKLRTSEKLREANTAALRKIYENASEIQERQAAAEKEAKIQRSQKRDTLMPKLIPAAGIIGYHVASAYYYFLKKTERREDAMERTISEHRLNVKIYSKEIENYSKSVEEHEASIRGCERRLWELWELEVMKMVLQKQILQLQERLRRTTCFLSKLAEKVHAADMTTRYSCDYENLQHILADMEWHVLPLLTTKNIEIQKRGLLSRPEITNFILKLKRLLEVQEIFKNIFYRVKKYLPFGKSFSIRYFSLSILIFFLIGLFSLLISSLFLFFTRLSFFLIRHLFLLIHFLFLSLLRFSFFLFSSPWFYVCVILLYILIKCLPIFSKRKCKQSG